MSHDTPNIAAVNHVAQVMSASLEYINQLNNDYGIACL